MAPDQTNLLQGTLDMMILKSLALAEMQEGFHTMQPARKYYKLTSAGRRQLERKRSAGAVLR